MLYNKIPLLLSQLEVHVLGLSSQPRVYDDLIKLKRKKMGVKYI